MPSELKKPEPVAKIVNRPSFDLLIIQWMVKDQRSIPDGTLLVTDAQLEQYAADRVREALERAAQAVLARARNARGSDFPDERDFANAVLALKEQTK